MSKMTQVSHQQWGEVPGQGKVDLWLLQTSQVQVEILTLGATIKSVRSRGNNGEMADLVLGYDDLEGKRNTQYSGDLEKKMRFKLDGMFSCADFGLQIYKAEQAYFSFR